MKKCPHKCCRLTVPILFIIFILGFYMTVTNTPLFGIPAPFGGEEATGTDTEVIEEIQPSTLNFTTGVVEILPAQ